MISIDDYFVNSGIGFSISSIEISVDVLTYTTKQGVVQSVVKLRLVIIVSICAETKQISRLTSLSGIVATSRRGATEVGLRTLELVCFMSLN